ncbi:hypothetical protein V8E36_007717 [Tilletia maclaganii]
MPVWFQFRPQYPEALYDLERFYEGREIIHTALKKLLAASSASSNVPSHIDAFFAKGANVLEYPGIQAKHDDFIKQYGRCEDPLVEASNRLLALLLENERRIDAQEHVLNSGRSQIWLKETFAPWRFRSQQEHETVHSSDDDDEDDDDEDEEADDDEEDEEEEEDNDDEHEDAEEDHDQADLSSSSWPAESTPIVRRTTNAFAHGPVLSPPSISTASESVSFSQWYNTIIPFKAKYEQGPSSRATSSSYGYSDSGSSKSAKSSSAPTTAEEDDESISDSQCSASMDFTEVFVAGAGRADKTVIEHSVISARDLSAVSLWPNTIGRHKSIKHIVERPTSSIPVRTAALYAGLMDAKPILTRPVLETPVRSLFPAKPSIFERVAITPVKREKNSGIPRLVGPNVPARVKAYPRRVTRL